MDEQLYDEFGTYIGPDLESDDSDEEMETQTYGEVRSPSGEGLDPRHALFSLFSMGLHIIVVD